MHAEKVITIERQKLADAELRLKPVKRVLAI